MGERQPAGLAKCQERKGKEKGKRKKKQHIHIVGEKRGSSGPIATPLPQCYNDAASCVENPRNSLTATTKLGTRNPYLADPEAERRRERLISLHPRTFCLQSVLSPPLSLWSWILAYSSIFCLKVDFRNASTFGVGREWEGVVPPVSDPAGRIFETWWVWIGRRKEAVVWSGEGFYIQS